MQHLRFHLETQVLHLHCARWRTLIVHFNNSSAADTPPRHIGTAVDYHPAEEEERLLHALKREIQGGRFSFFSIN
ncbi:MAG: hypothetical protein Q4D28_09890, partial [Prevotellaceae bacterium]|nr:hypothetical protein [Prevotellaceae bacterium]